MAKITKSEKRQKSNFKKRNGMRISGKSAFLIQQVLIKRAQETTKQGK